MRFLCLILFAAAAAMPSNAQNANSPEAPRWASLRFLIGEWIGTGAGQPGASTGAFSFRPELGGHILVRRSFAGRAKSRHEDLLIIYSDSATPSGPAIYFDSEGHVIRYRVTVPSPGTAVFESDPGDPGPRYRLTYTTAGRDLDGKFEISTPGARQYKTYLSWKSTPSASN